MLGLLRRRPELARLFAADVVSLLGDWLTYVAVGVLALRSPESVWALAGVHLAHTIPQIAAAPIAGWLTDRLDRRRLATVASVGRGIVALAMAGCAAIGALEWVGLLLFVRMAGSPFVATPLSAMMPRLVAEDELAAANALRGASWSFVFTAGVALGGVVSALLGPAIALALDAVTFFAAALLLAGLAPDRAQRASCSPSASLVNDASAHPERLHAALAKVPAQIACGAAFVALGGLAGGALGLGALHAVRGAGQGLVPWLLHRRVGARSMIAAGTASCAIGTAILCWNAESSGALAIGCALWGAGAGASWVGATTALQQTTPASILGRYAALDVALSSLASAVGALSFALLAPAPRVVLVAAFGSLALLAVPRARHAVAALAVGAILLAPLDARAQDRWLLDALRARAVTDAHFAMRDLYTWTSEDQAARIREERTLLWASASEGAVRAPYQRALDELASSRTESGAIARALTDHPRLARRRYAWTTPYGTVLPRGGRSYGPVLVHVRLKRDVWLGRFAPEEDPPFRFSDDRGRPVPARTVLASPERLAAVYHVRSRARGGAYREIVLHNESLVERFAIDTRGVRTRVREDLRILRRLRARAWPHRALAPFWRAPPGDDLHALFAATMAFDTPRHRPTEASLRELTRALAAWRPSGRPFERSVE